MPSDEEERDRQVTAAWAAISPEQRKQERFERECRRAFIKAYTDLDKQVAAATGDRMRVFKTAAKDWEARSHVFPTSREVDGVAGFVFSVETPKDAGDLFFRSFAVTAPNYEQAGVKNATSAEAIAAAKRIAAKIIGEMERDGVSLRRWTDIRKGVLEGAQAAFNASEDRRRRFRLMAGAGVGLVLVAAALFALAQIDAR